MILRINSDADLERYRGTLRGKFILTEAPPPASAFSTHDVRPDRWSDEMLKRSFEEGVLPGEAYDWAGGIPSANVRRAIYGIREFLMDEGIAAWIGYGGEDRGWVWVEWAVPSAPELPPSIFLAVEHYGRIWRNLERGIPVELEMNIQNTRYVDARNSFNVLAEIPGGDKADELVIFGAHLDGWHTGTGATDNANGVAVMMEAMRILKTLGLPMRRTVQIALWGGEEDGGNGLYGSRSYVEKYVRSGHAKVSLLVNFDRGPGRIRGAFLMGNEVIAPIFARWMEPLHHLGMTTLIPRATFGSDHVPFHDAGVPTAWFLQDPLSQAGHTNMDTFERLVEEDLQQAAAVVATFVYHAANREEMLPRAPGAN